MNFKFKKMETIVADNWESTVVSPETVAGKIKPGMSIFLGTAGAEPRTMVRHLMTADAKNLEIFGKYLFQPVRPGTQGVPDANA